MKRSVFLFGFLIAFTSIHTAESKNILELYNEIPFSKIERIGEGNTERYNILQQGTSFIAMPQGGQGSKTTVIVDSKNGYLRVSEDVYGNGSFGTYIHEAAKFNGSNDRIFLGFYMHHSGPFFNENQTIFYEYKNGKLIDSTKQVLPPISIVDFVPKGFSATLLKELEEINQDISWHLPQYGTSLTVKFRKSYLADKFEYEDPPVMSKKVQELAAAINREEIQLKWNREKCVFER